MQPNDSQGQAVPVSEPPWEEPRSLGSVLLSDANQLAVHAAEMATGYGLARFVDKMRKPPDGPAGPTASGGENPPVPRDGDSST